MGPIILDSTTSLALILAVYGVWNGADYYVLIGGHVFHAIGQYTQFDK